MLQSKDHPLNFEYGEDDEDDEDYNDLSFATSVNTSIKQDVKISAPSSSSLSSSTGNNDNDVFISSIHDTDMTIPHGEMQPQTQHNDVKSSSNDSSASASMYMPTILNEKSSHPLALILHCLFKFFAFVTYVFGGFFLGSSHSGTNFIIITVFCLLFLAADFWVVKNITGRLLVRLRWWNMLSADGMTTRWVFESDDEHSTINQFDKLIFWGVLYTTPLLWGSLFFIGLLKFNLGWLINVIVGLVLSSSNVYGYWKCSSEQKAKFQSMVSTGAQMGAMGIIRNNLLGTFFGLQQSQQQPQQFTSGTYT